MKNISLAFWNLQNLFESKKNNHDRSEFTPENGWTEKVVEKKISNIASIIRSLNKNNGPDILGICEIESEKLAYRLIKEIGRRDLVVAEYKNSEDMRGIDTCLIYSSEIFYCKEVNVFSPHIRFPTRNILHARLEIKFNNAEINVLVNHWPSRRGKSTTNDGNPGNTEYLRLIAAEECGRIVDRILKLSTEELKIFPENFSDNLVYLRKIADKWNRNIILMGDFNDEPFDKSLINHLFTTPRIDLLMDWIENLSVVRQDRENIKKNDKEIYRSLVPYLYNPMWKLIPDFTFYGWKYNYRNLFDQFIISRGLLFGEQKLKMDLNSIEIFKEKMTLSSNLPENEFDRNNIDKFHLIEKNAPMKFVFNGKLKGQESNTGFSDHFPIQCKIDLVDKSDIPIMNN